MRIGAKDAAATLLVAAIVVPYVGYVTRGSMPFVEDPRGMSGVGLILGAIGFAVLARDGFHSRRLRQFAAVAGVVTLGLGLVALALESEYVLAAFVAAIAAVWAVIEGTRLMTVTPRVRGGTRAS